MPLCVLFLDMSLFATVCVFYSARARFNRHPQCLAELKCGKQSNIPIYDFSLHQRLEETKYLYGASIIIAEGIMALQNASLRSLYDLKVRMRSGRESQFAEGLLQVFVQCA